MFTWCVILRNEVVNPEDMTHCAQASIVSN